MRPELQKLNLIDTIFRISEQKKLSSRGEPRRCAGCSKSCGLPAWFLNSGIVYRVFACNLCVKRLRKEGTLVERSSETLRQRIRGLSLKARLFLLTEEDRLTAIEAQLAIPRRQELDQRKRAIAVLKVRCPRISQLKLCAKMDAKAQGDPEYGPLESWKTRLWTDAYHNPSTRKKVEVYLSKIKAWPPK